MIGDPMTVGIGPYNFMGNAGGYGVDMGGFNDMSLMPILQNYGNQVSRLNDLADSRVNSNVASPSSTLSDIPVPTFDSEKYWSQMEANQDRMMDNSIRQSQRWRQNSSVVNSPLYNITEAVDLLHDKILQNEQDQVQEALSQLKVAIKEANYPGQEDVDDKMLLAEAKNMYRNRFGRRVEDDLREYGTSSFWNGFIRKATFGFFGDKLTAEDNIAEINGQQVSTSSKKWNIAGKAAGGTALTLGGAGIGFCFGGPVGAVIGGAIGLIASLF